MKRLRIGDTLCPDWIKNISFFSLTDEARLPERASVTGCPDGCTPQEEGTKEQAKIVYFEEIRLEESKVEVIEEPLEMIPFNHQIGRR